MRRVKSASSLTGGHDHSQSAWIREEGAVQTGVLEGQHGEGSGRGHLNKPGPRAQTLSQKFTSGRHQGLGMGSEGAKFDSGFCGLSDAL